MRSILTLLTDFGAGSGYPAQMKGVLLSALPDAQLVDLSHDVPAFDVLAGALMLEACAPWFPAAAVHLAIVDPGVGTDRRPLCVVDRDGRRFVGPDNGIFTPFLPGARCFEIVNPDVAPEPRSSTFHGRDLFAPVAAWLARGGDPHKLGPAVLDPVRLRWPRAARDGDWMVGEVIWSDAFGNLVSSFWADDLPAGAAHVEVGGRPVRLVKTFGEGEPGEMIALVGSGGRLEIAVREGNAARELGNWRGARVMVTGPDAA